MDAPNAFAGRTAMPTLEEISTALGETAALWEEFIDWVAEQGASVQEWKSISPKYGWSLRLKLKKRAIVHMSPCNACFRVAFILGDKAVAAARKSNLSKATIKLLDKAPHYAEGTGLRFLVKAQKDLVPLRKLALIKLAN